MNQTMIKVLNMKLPYAVEKAMKKIMDAGGQAFLVAEHCGIGCWDCLCLTMILQLHFCPARLKNIFR